MARVAVDAKRVDGATFVLERATRLANNEIDPVMLISGLLQCIN